MMYAAPRRFQQLSAAGEPAAVMWRDLEFGNERNQGLYAGPGERWRKGTPG
jgi:hypothetical protein